MYSRFRPEGPKLERSHLYDSSSCESFILIGARATYRSVNLLQFLQFFVTKNFNFIIIHLLIRMRTITTVNPFSVQTKWTQL